MYYVLSTLNQLCATNFKLYAVLSIENIKINWMGMEVNSISNSVLICGKTPIKILIL